MTEDYKVGYRKPPLHARFQKGKSGNPRGRTKGSKNLLTLIARQMKEKVTVRTGDQARQISALEALVVSIWQKALRGDPRSVDRVLQWNEMLEAKAEQVGEKSKMAQEIVDLIKQITNTKHNDT